MSGRNSRWFLAPVMVLVVAACGATTTPAPPTGGNGGTESPASTEAATEAASAAPTEAATPAATEAGGTSGGGASSGKACDLLTAAEVEAATQQSAVKAEAVAAGDTEGLSACGYVAGGVTPVVILTILDPTNTNTDPAGYLLLPGSAQVALSGGANAVWVPAAGNVLLVFKHDVVVSVQAFFPGPGEEIQQTAAKLAQIVADRLG
jgi:hypothetical protein